MVYYTLETVQLSQIVCDYSVITDVSCRRHARKVMTMQLVYGYKYTTSQLETVSQTGVHVQEVSGCS